tara:strand:+ start:221 stop:448 length:228 start_codon:yes stop_codon:yes gene_type:complete
MSKISKEGYAELQVIKNALDSMFDKLDKTMFLPKGKTPKNIDGSYDEINPFNSVKDEFEAIAGIIEKSAGWAEVK